MYELFTNILSRRAAAMPEKTAIRFLEGGTAVEVPITYAALHNAAGAMAARIRSLGAVKTDRALLLYPPGIDYIAALFGCFYAGVSALPAYPPRFNRPSERLDLLARDAGASFALTAPNLWERLEPAVANNPALNGLRWIGLDVDGVRGDDTYLDPTLRPEDVAFIQYTSGSTAAPRGVVLSHANLLANVTLLSQHVAADPEADRVVSWLPPYHDMGLIGTILAPLAAGMEAVLMSPSTFMHRPIRWLQAVDKYHGTITAAPNFAYDMCVTRTKPSERSAVDLSRLRVALNGAERVRADTMQRFSEAFAPSGFRAERFCPCYGLAEATLGVTMAPLGRPPRVIHLEEASLGQGAVVQTDGGAGQAMVGCGPPLPGIDIRIVDPTSASLVAADRVGEIWMRAQGVARGYWGQAEQTREVFGALLEEGEPPYLATGDLGFIREGELFVTGRRKDLLIILGVNHYPEDIEATAERSHDRLRERGTIAFSCELDGEERLVLVCEVDTPKDLPAQAIQAAIRRAVADAHGLPVHAVCLVRGGQTPKTSSGKPRRSLCKERYLSGALPLIAADTSPIQDEAPPETIAAVAAVMAEVLGAAEVKETDDFFALGGHSLLATQLASRLEEAWDAEVPIRLVFEAPTPRALAARRAALSPKSGESLVRPIPRDGVLPLSHSQERMWFLHELEPDGAAYNVAGALVVDGPLDAAAFHRAFQALVDRHETLRTCYVKVDGAPRPVIVDALAVEMPLIDLSGEPDPMAAAAAEGSTFAHVPFDLASGPLIRQRLFRLGSEQHAVVVSIHHIISDAWSLGLMLIELLADYNALVEGGRPNEIPEKIQYVDYAAWQRRWYDAKRFEKEMAFWRAHLDGVPPLVLPADRPRRSAPTSAGALEPLDLSEQLIGNLRELAHANDATLFMVMFAAFQVLLYRYTRQTDFAVGIPIANRNHRASEQLFGTLVNTLAVRCRLDPDAVFTAHLGQTRATCIDAYAHQDLPFERLVSELRLSRRAGESPLIQVMLDYQNPPMPIAATGKLRLRPLFISRRASQFDISLLLMDAEIGQVAGLEYRTELFDRTTIQRVLRHYHALLEEIVLDPERPVAQIPLMSAVEQAEVARLGANYDQGFLPDDTVVGRVDAQVAAHPEAIAVQDCHGSLTYEAMARAIHEVASALSRAGVGPGARVVVCLQRTRLIPIALLATSRLGATYVPVDPGFPEDRVRFMLEEASPAVVITDAPSQDQLPLLRRYRTMALDPREDRAPVRQTVPAAAAADTSAYILYTSGSTGKPKGVEISHGALLNFLDAMAQVPGFTAADHLLSVTTISFDIAGLELFLPLITGGTVTIATKETTLDGRALAALMISSGATVVQATPATWRMLIESGWQGDGRLRILCGGEALPSPLADQLLARGGSLWNMYGPTETTIWSSVAEIRADQEITIGRPIDRTRMYVLDDRLQLVPPGVSGEIFIGGAGVAKGYFERPELTAKQFLSDPFAGEAGARMYRTGDLGRMRLDGIFECFGRLDHQVKIRGFRIELGEIEAVLGAQAGVTAAVAAPFEVAPGDTRLAAYLVADPLPDTDTLREALQRALPEYMIPAWIIALDALPQTANGKVDRKALPRPSALPPSRERRERARPRDGDEERIAAIWSDVLGVAAPDIHDNFFDFGHSLLAARLFARIDRELGVALPLSILFDSPTIAALAVAVRTARKTPSSHLLREPGHVVAVKSGGTLPPLFCVHGAGGNVLNLQRLAVHLGPEQPFYGIQARGIDGTGMPFAAIEEMAAAYIEDMAAVQPRGPYFLSGYCGGGIVAFEMARRLQAAGETVALLALIDTYRPGVPTLRPNLRNRLLAITAKGPKYIAKRSKERIRSWREDIAHDRRIAESIVAGRPVPYEAREHWLMTAFLEAVAAYELRPYDGELIVFQAVDVEPILRCAVPNLGWDEYAAAIESHDTPGNHHSLADEPHVRMLAARLNACMARALEVHRPSPEDDGWPPVKPSPSGISHERSATGKSLPSLMPKRRSATSK